MSAKRPPDRPAGVQVASPEQVPASQAEARAALEALADPQVDEILETWSIMEGAAGQIGALEEEIAGQAFPDQDQATDYLLRQRAGHVSILARIMFSLAGQVDGRFQSFFRAAAVCGAGFDEEHAAAGPGALFGLGLAINDFEAFFEEVKSMAFYPAAFGRRRRTEVTLVAYRQWEQGQVPQAFLAAEAERFAGQFNEAQVDTAASALFFLIEKHHPQAANIFNSMFERAHFSEANWQTAVLFVEESRKHADPALGPGLKLALDKNLGRHDDGERALVTRAYAACAGPAAARDLAGRLEDISSRHADCERAALLAGLIQAEPTQAAWADQARASLGDMLAGHLDATRFGAAASLLQAVAEAGLPGFADLAAAVWEHSRKDENAKGKLKHWLQENLPAFS